MLKIKKFNFKQFKIYNTKNMKDKIKEIMKS